MFGGRALLAPRFGISNTTRFGFYPNLSRFPREHIGTTEHPLLLRSYSPFPADLNIDPLYRFFSPNTDTISGADVETLEPLAHLKRDFEIDGLRLNDSLRVPG